MERSPQPQESSRPAETRRISAFLGMLQGRFAATVGAVSVVGVGSFMAGDMHGRRQIPEVNIGSQVCPLGENVNSERIRAIFEVDSFLREARYVFRDGYLALNQNPPADYHTALAVYLGLPEGQRITGVMPVATVDGIADDMIGRRVGAVRVNVQKDGKEILYYTLYRTGEVMVATAPFVVDSNGTSIPPMNAPETTLPEPKKAPATPDPQGEVY